MAFVVIGRRFLIIFSCFVDGVVGQVHVFVGHVFASGFFVRLRAEAGKCHLMQVDSEWFNSITENVKS